MRVSEKAIRRRAIVMVIEFFLRMGIVAAAVLVPMWLGGYLCHLLGV